MTKRQVSKAVRRALTIFDKWNEITGCFPNGSYLAEIESIIEDAVHCGIQEALEDFKKLESEND